MATYRVTGVKAAMDGFPCLRNFQLAIRGADTKSFCSAGSGAVRSAGNADWSVSAMGYGLPAKMPGQYFTFTGSDRKGQGWQSGSEDSRGGALVSKVVIFCPIETSKHIYHHLLAVANGSIAKGSYSASDAAAPAPLNPKGLSFKFDLAAVYGVLGWKLTIDCNPTAPTYPSHLAGWPGRDPGNVDAEIEWEQTFDAMSQLVSINSFHQFDAYVDATRFYQMINGQVLEEPTEYPIEGQQGNAELIAAKCKANWTSYTNSVQGSIKIPGGGVYWPTNYATYLAL